MIDLMSEITKEVSFSQQDHHLHLCPQMKQAWESVLLKGTSWHTNPLFLRASPML